MENVHTRQRLQVFEPLAIATTKLKGAKRPILVAYLFILLLKLAFFAFEFLPVEDVPAIFFYISDSLSYVLESVLLLGISYIGVRRALDLPISYRNMFAVLQPKILFKVLLIGLLVIGVPVLLFICSFMVNIWLFLLLLPILPYLIMRYSMATMLAIHKKLTIPQAIQQSMQMTKSNFWRLFSAVVVGYFVFFIGFIPLGIGLIWTFPLATIYFGEIYKSLLLNVE